MEHFPLSKEYFNMQAEGKNFLADQTLVLKVLLDNYSDNGDELEMLRKAYEIGLPQTLADTGKMSIAQLNMCADAVAKENMKLRPIAEQAVRCWAKAVGAEIESPGAHKLAVSALVRSSVISFLIFALGAFIMKSEMYFPGMWKKVMSVYYAKKLVPILPHIGIGIMLIAVVIFVIGFSAYVKARNKYR